MLIRDKIIVGRFKDVLAALQFKHWRDVKLDGQLNIIEDDVKPKYTYNYLDIQLRDIDWGFGIINLYNDIKSYVYLTDQDLCTYDLYICDNVDELQTKFKLYDDKVKDNKLIIHIIYDKLSDIPSGLYKLNYKQSYKPLYLLMLDNNE